MPSEETFDKINFAFQLCKLELFCASGMVAGAGFSGIIDHGIFTATGLTGSAGFALLGLGVGLGCGAGLADNLGRFDSEYLEPFYAFSGLAGFGAAATWSALALGDVPAAAFLAGITVVSASLAALFNLSLIESLKPRRPAYHPGYPAALRR